MEIVWRNDGFSPESKTWVWVKIHQRTVGEKKWKGMKKRFPGGINFSISFSLFFSLIFSYLSTHLVSPFSYLFLFLYSWNQMGQVRKCMMEDREELFFLMSCGFPILHQYLLGLRTSEIHLFYDLQLFYWHFIEILWLFIFHVFYFLSLLFFLVSLRFHFFIFWILISSFYCQ